MGIGSWIQYSKLLLLAGFSGLFHLLDTTVVLLQEHGFVAKTLGCSLWSFWFIAWVIS